MAQYSASTPELPSAPEVTNYDAIFVGPCGSSWFSNQTYYFYQAGVFTNINGTELVSSNYLAAAGYNGYNTSLVQQDPNLWFGGSMHFAYTNAVPVIYPTNVWYSAGIDTALYGTNNPPGTNYFQLISAGDSSNGPGLNPRTFTYSSAIPTRIYTITTNFVYYTNCLVVSGAGTSAVNLPYSTNAVGNIAGSSFWTNGQYQISDYQQSFLSNGVSWFYEIGTIQLNTDEGVTVYYGQACETNSLTTLARLTNNAWMDGSIQIANDTGYLTFGYSPAPTVTYHAVYTNIVSIQTNYF